MSNFPILFQPIPHKINTNGGGQKKLAETATTLLPQAAQRGAENAEGVRVFPNLFSCFVNTILFVLSDPTDAYCIPERKLNCHEFLCWHINQQAIH